MKYTEKQSLTNAAAAEDFLSDVDFPDPQAKEFLADILSTAIGFCVCCQQMQIPINKRAFFRTAEENSEAVGETLRPTSH